MYNYLDTLENINKTLIWLDDDNSGYEDKEVIEPVFKSYKKEKELIKIELEDEDEILPQSKRIKLEKSSNDKDLKKIFRKKEKNIEKDLDDLIDQENNFVSQKEDCQSKTNSHYYRVSILYFWSIISTNRNH